MTKLAESSGTVIYEAGNKLYISKRPAQWTTVFLYVTGLLAVIFLANAVLQFAGLTNEIAGSLMQLILILPGIIFAFVFWGVWLHRKKVNAIPPKELNHIAIFDFESNNLLDGQQNILSPLNQAWLMRKMQITSSSPELIIQWSQGHLSIVRGNPFSGGITGIEKVLLAKGIRKK